MHLPTNSLDCDCHAKLRNIWDTSERPRKINATYGYLRKVMACNKSATDRRKHTTQNNFQSQPLKICFSAKRKFPFRQKYSVSIKILNRPK